MKELGLEKMKKINAGGFAAGSGANLECIFIGFHWFILAWQIAGCVSKRV